MLDMQSACIDPDGMSVNIQIRDVPDAVHRRLKAKAALAGMSLSQYLLAEVTHLAEMLTNSEIRERLAQLPRLDSGGLTPEEIIRQDRDSR